MKLIRRLFGRRRWILWLPYLATVLQVLKAPATLFPARVAVSRWGNNRGNLEPIRKFLSFKFK